VLIGASGGREQPVLDSVVEELGELDMVLNMRWNCETCVGSVFANGETNGILILFLIFIDVFLLPFSQCVVWITFLPGLLPLGHAMHGDVSEVHAKCIIDKVRKGYSSMMMPLFVFFPFSCHHSDWFRLFAFTTGVM
jgi:hypothetical protein